MKNEMNPNSRPGPMEGSVLLIWGSLALMAGGFSAHRMGPSFQRSRFGPPIILLGLASFILLPNGLANPEAEMHDSLVSSLPWLTAATVGTYLVLYGAPTYWKLQPVPALLGWSSIIVSWALIYSGTPFLDPGEILRCLWALLGITLGFAAFFIVTWISGRNYSMEEEASPLNDDESRVVTSILSRRLGGDGSGF